MSKSKTQDIFDEIDQVCKKSCSIEVKELMKRLESQDQIEIINKDEDYDEYHVMCCICIAAFTGKLQDLRSLISRFQETYKEKYYFVVCKALDFAVLAGNLSVVKHLLEETMNLNIEHKYEKIMLFAALNGHLSIVKYCLTKGMKINAKDGYGNTALHFAAIEGNQKIFLEIIRDVSVAQNLSLRAQKKVLGIVNDILDCNHDEYKEFVKQYRVEIDLANKELSYCVNQRESMRISKICASMPVVSIIGLVVTSYCGRISCSSAVFIALISISAAFFVSAIASNLVCRARYEAGNKRIKLSAPLQLIESKSEDVIDQQQIIGSFCNTISARNSCFSF